MSYPKGWWTERVIRTEVVVEKLLFWWGYRVVNLVTYEVLASRGISGLASRAETDRECPIWVRTLEEADKLKKRRRTERLDIYTA
jgi:hypothetical protein